MSSSSFATAQVVKSSGNVACFSNTSVKRACMGARKLSCLEDTPTTSIIKKKSTATSVTSRPWRSMSDKMSDTSAKESSSPRASTLTHRSLNATATRQIFRASETPSSESFAALACASKPRVTAFIA